MKNRRIKISFGFHDGNQQPHQMFGQLYSFASERLCYYQDLNKHKGRVDLLSLVESVDESSDEIREVYMERQY